MLLISFITINHVLGLLFFDSGIIDINDAKTWNIAPIASNSPRNIIVIYLDIDHSYFGRSCVHITLTTFSCYFLYSFFGYIDL